MKVIEEEAAVFEQNFVSEIEQAADKSITDRRTHFERNQSLPVN